MTRNVIFLAIFLTASSCASATFTRKAYVKRDRYGEAPVIDMRNMESFNQRKFEERKTPQKTDETL